jgi:hypothetical protein
MLPIIKNRLIPSIGQMHDIAKRYIFDRSSVSLVEMRVLEEGVECWSKKVDLNASDRWEVTRIVNALIADERGHFNRAKALLAMRGLHYNQLYNKGLPFIADPYKTRTFGKS